MEQKYQLLTKLELTKRKEDFSQIGEEPQYSVIKKLYSYMKEYGAVREDVYIYLLEHMVFEEYSLLILNGLIKTFAGPEWFELIKEVEQRKNDFMASRGSICLFEQLILEAYRENIPFEYVDQKLKQSKYPYEMSQKIEQYRQKKHTELEKQIEELKTIIQEQKSNKQEDIEQEYIENQEQWVASELEEEISMPEEFEESSKIEIALKVDDNSQILLLIKELLTENEKQYKDLMTLNTWIQQLFIPMEEKEELSEELEKERTEEKIEVSQNEIKETTTTIKTKEKNSSEQIRLVRIFQKLREWKKVTAFRKLTDRQKLEELSKDERKKLQRKSDSYY